MNRSDSFANMINIRKYSNRNTSKKVTREIQIGLLSL